MRWLVCRVPEVPQGQLSWPELPYTESIIVNSPQVALKDRGIDKLLDEAREDNKENDVRLLSPKSELNCHL